MITYIIIVAMLIYEYWSQYFYLYAELVCWLFLFVAAVVAVVAITSIVISWIVVKICDI
jgi:hypothetical protein